MVYVNNVAFGVVLTFFGYLSVNLSAPTENVLTTNLSSSISRWKFNKLLNSIANVNKERLDALKKYIDLGKYNKAQGILRLSNERDPLVIVLFLNKSDPSASVVHEIYDSDMKTTPGETPVKNFLQQFEDYYDDALETDETKEVTFNFGDQDVLKKLYGTNHHIRTAREVKIDPRDGEEISPSTNNIQGRGVSYADTREGEEITNKSVKTNSIKGTSKTNTKEDIIDDITNLKMNGSEFDTKQILRLFASCTKKVVKACTKACKSASKSVCETYKCSGSLKRSFKKHCKSACKSKFDD